MRVSARGFMHGRPNLTTRSWRFP